MAGKTAGKNLLQLAQDLEWLGCELEHCGHQHATEGFPEAGLTWDTFLEKQRGVLMTAEKVERELKSSVRYNPTSLMGLDYPLEAALDSVTTLLTAVEAIKQAAIFSVDQLPHQVRDFTRMVESYLEAGGSV